METHKRKLTDALGLIQEKRTTRSERPAVINYENINAPLLRIARAR